MELSLAAKYFDTTVLEGWNGSGWDAAVATGNFMVFDRFISDRNFGQRKRNFTTGGAAIPAQYEVVRLPGGQVYLIEAANHDTRDGADYSLIYLLHEAPLTLDVVRVSTTARSSGAAGTPVETVVADDVFADIERYSSRKSDEHETVRYGVYEVYLPASTDVKTSDYLKVGTDEYNVTEVMTQLKLKYVRATKRAAS